MRTTVAMLGAATLLLAACAESTTEQAAPDPEVAASNGQPVREEAVGCDDVDFYWDDEGCDPATMIDLDEVASGGPPPDGIPPIDDPTFESVDEASQWLEDDSPVMVVEIDDDVRAYPLAILTWHEIVNDEVGGVPMVVTYCPLCNSALAFERTIEGPDGEELVLDFGTSGRLYQSNLIMYDRQTHHLWTQFDGEAVIGDERLLGADLERVPAWLLGFGEFAAAHPDAPVLSRDTGFSRDYGRNPYQGYDGEDAQPFLFDGEVDERFPAMTRVVGLEEDGEATAVLLEQLTEQRVVPVEVGGESLVVLWAPGQASALDTAAIDQGREVGQTGAFMAELDGRTVELEPRDDGRFVEPETGSVLDVRGRVVEGALEGERLEPVIHDDTFWFVWTAFREETGVVDS
jgi:hypothetical protein